MNPVVLKLEGGLGNQLFEFAAGYFLAGKLDTSLLLDQYGIPLSNHFRELELSFGEYKWPEINGKNRISVLPGTMKRSLAILAKEFPVVERLFLKYRMHSSNVFNSTIYCENENDTDFFNIVDSVKLHGNFQSWKIVEEATKYGFPRVLELKKLSNWVSDLVGNNDLQNSIAIHFRMGQDSVDNIDFSQPSIKYYVCAIDYLRSFYENASIYVFSDDITLVKKRYGDILGKDCIFVDPPSGERAAQKQFLLSKFGSLVCANSTFCCWAGWSLANMGGNVVIPYPFSDSTKRGSRDFPANWTKMSKTTGEIISD